MDGLLNVCPPSPSNLAPHSGGAGGRDLPLIPSSGAIWTVHVHCALHSSGGAHPIAAPAGGCSFMMFVDFCGVPSALKRAATSQTSEGSIWCLVGDHSSSSALQVTRLGEKALQSARRNILQELEVILLEHGLPAKLAEVEYLAAQGGMLLPDGTQQDAPAPAHALRSMMAQARRAEKSRLEALCAQMEEENDELRSEITKQAEALRIPTSNVAKAQQFTDTVYDTLSNV